jgi:Alkylmercury lyase
VKDLTRCGQVPCAEIEDWEQAAAAQKDGELCVLVLLSLLCAPRCNYFRACCCRVLFFSNQNEALRVLSAHPTKTLQILSLQVVKNLSKSIFEITIKII